MPRISVEKYYNGFEMKVQRLGIDGLVDEVRQAVTGFELNILPSRHANGTRGIRLSIDAGFERLGLWNKITSGGVDWSKKTASGVSIGVEVQVSGRSDMLAVDIMHLKDRIQSGDIDIGIIVVPDNQLSLYLTDRTPNFSTAIKHVEHRASDLPILVIGFTNDGVGPALDKMRTNLGRLD